MEEQKKTYSFVDKRGENKPEEPAKKIDESLKSEPQKTEESPAPEKKSETRYNQQDINIDLSTLVMSFATSAIVAMGKAPDPHTGQVFQDFTIAQQNIDIVALLEEKTKGNRTREEDNLFEGVLYELRMLFVEARKGGTK
ncbi:MAG TPA: DUF1844 domain-containing protein [Desulfomonilia bacterium]|jgi:hypothetical protein